jgi:hypothetical protein
VQRNPASATRANDGRLPIDPPFLTVLRELTSQHRVLLIFDELATGFRLTRRCLGRISSTHPMDNAGILPRSRCAPGPGTDSERGIARSAAMGYLCLILWFAAHQREFQYTLGGARVTPEAVELEGFVAVEGL